MRTSSGGETIDLIHTMQVGIPDFSYTPVSVIDRGEDGLTGTSDDGTLTVFSQNPATFGQEAFLETNPNNFGSDNGREYRGFEFVANKRLSNSWQFVGSLVIQHMELLTPTNSFYTTGLFQNPNDQVNARGRDPLSETVLVKLQGIYQAPWGILLSGYYRFGSGSPITRTLVVRGLPQGTITLLAEKRGDRETPDNNLTRLPCREGLCCWGRAPCVARARRLQPDERLDSDFSGREHRSRPWDAAHHREPSDRPHWRALRLVGSAQNLESLRVH